MGVSRTAVWKQLNKLSRDTGIEIESVKGRGYRITEASTCWMPVTWSRG